MARRVEVAHVAEMLPFPPGLLAIAALLVATTFGQTGPHVAQGRVEMLFVSPDGARIVTGTMRDMAEWDAKTGELIWSNSYAGLGLPRVSSVGTLSPDGRYFTTYNDNRYGIIDLGARIGWPITQRIAGWTYNGKARSDSRGGVDIQTGKHVPLTEPEQDVMPLGNGTYYSYNAKQQNYYLFDPATGKATKLDKKGKEDLIRRKDVSSSQLARWLDADRFVRVLHDTGEVVVQRYSSRAELNRFPLKIGKTAWGYYAPIAVVPGPEPLLLVSGDTSYQKGSKSIYRGFLTAYKMPSGEIAYTIPLHGSEEAALEWYRDQDLSEEQRAKKNAAQIAARNAANASRPGQTYEIGQRVGDGIVVYVDGSGQHGLILELNEQASGKPSDVPQRTGGDAWFLPTLDEWKTVYGERRRIEFALEREKGAPLGKNGYYWTATQVSYSGATRGPVIANNWTYQPLNNDARETATANIVAAVRRMRAF